jgi:KDO2-lipid IV(A) lauroyltransferase
MFKFYLYKFAHFLVNVLPLSAAYRLGIVLSDLQYFFSPRDRKAVFNNLRCILKYKENLNVQTREVFRNFGRYLVEFFRMEKHFNAQFIKDKVKIENIESLEEARKYGKGGIILSAHIGNWEVGGALLSLLGYDLMEIALPHKERPVNDFFNYQREVKGITVVPSTKAIRQCIEQLRNNKFIAVAADRDFTMNGEILDFLGKKMLIPKGAAVFSGKTGAPIIPCFMIRNGDGTFTFKIYKIIYPSAESSETVDRNQLISLMKKSTKVIEDIVSRYPTQWLVFRQFWIEEEMVPFSE